MTTFLYIFSSLVFIPWRSLSATNIVEAIGYCFRIYLGQPAHDGNIPLYANTTLLLLLPPLILALGGYIAVARIISFSQTSTFIKPKVVENFFFCIDCLAFVVQAGGGGMTAIAALASIGSKIALIGLFVGLLSFLSFSVITIYVQNSSKFVFQSLDSRKQQYGYRNWRPIYIPLYINIVVLLIRSIYRIVENAQGYDGYLMNHEYYFYGFDTLMILIATGSYIIWYPGRYIQPDLIMADNEMLTESQEGTPNNLSLTNLK
ncbi:RTA1 like protein-domain-containing protein [Endogone sp. FLAS-F59071]|nr:RTA1 like protein-domain-containing protein [Endogone sp. FLAS-F59071]RUS19339.1 RTA1 like protein-domain-containing protein [Endogone sp. FLAS-F59071]|eukprot:RUS16534.1 RTA1 like protein-domain-containing protein [Endogone sp. FLAS-F59071]